VKPSWATGYITWARKGFGEKPHMGCGVYSVISHSKSRRAWYGVIDAEERIALPIHLGTNDPQLFHRRLTLLAFRIEGEHILIFLGGFSGILTERRGACETIPCVLSSTGESGAQLRRTRSRATSRPNCFGVRMQAL